MDKIGKEEFYDIITNKNISWQSLIYDLINSEQLDPWDIDLVYLTEKYLERIKQMEEANFFVSSKVLLAASLLLRIKSEILLNNYIKSIDEILFGKKEEKVKKEEKIDFEEVPELFLKTPLPRFKKVSLQELIGALEKAMKTETRRIKREIVEKEARMNTQIVIPKRKINMKERIKKFYHMVLLNIRKKPKISYSELTGNNKEEKKICFLPSLHLDTQKKIFLEQEKPFDEIWIQLYKHYKNNLKYSVEERKENKENTLFDNPLANFFEKLNDNIK